MHYVDKEPVLADTIAVIHSYSEWLLIVEEM